MESKEAQSILCDFAFDTDPDESMAIYVCDAEDAIEAAERDMKQKAIEAFCKQHNKDCHYCELAKTVDFSCRESCPSYKEFIDEINNE